jgi:thymidylate kinase
MSLVFDFNEKDTRLISPRRSRTSQKNHSQGIVQCIFKFIFGIMGYVYAFVTYLILFIYSKNRIVVCDRYFYQFFYDLFGKFADIMIRCLPKPTMTFFLNGNIDYFYKHMIDSNDASIGKDYYISVLQLYNRISNYYHFIELNVASDKTSISDIILKSILDKLRG